MARTLHVYPKAALGAYLIRPGSGNTVAYKTSGGNLRPLGSASTDSLTLAAAPVSGNAVLTAHYNDSKQIAYSNWLHGSTWR